MSNTPLEDGANEQDDALERGYALPNPLLLAIADTLQENTVMELNLVTQEDDGALPQIEVTENNRIDDNSLEVVLGNGDRYIVLVQKQ